MVNIALENHQMLMQPVQYVHWGDPVVVQAINSAAGALLIPISENVPAWILSTMQKKREAMLDGDFSAEGTISVQLFPDAHVVNPFDQPGVLTFAIAEDVMALELTVSRAVDTRGAVDHDALSSRLTKWTSLPTGPAAPTAELTASQTQGEVAERLKAPVC